MRHGLLSRSVLIEGRSPERLAALLNTLYADHEPATATEQILVGKMAVAQWRQRRLRAVDSARSPVRSVASPILATEPPPVRTMRALRSIAESGRLADLRSRYELRFDRRYYRALEALERAVPGDRLRRTSEFPRWDDRNRTRKSPAPFDPTGTP